MRGYAPVRLVPAILSVLVLVGGVSAGAALAHKGKHPHPHPHAKPQPKPHPKPPPPHVTRYKVVVGKPFRVRPVYIEGRPAGQVDFVVKPKTAQVFVDGKLRGIVDQFDGTPGYLHLPPGEHTIKLVAPDEATVTHVLLIEPDTRTKIKVNLVD